MPSIRITRFAGLLPQDNPKALANDHAQVAHDCLLWDGWLRPMPAWVLVQTVVTGVKSIFYLVDPTGPQYTFDDSLASAYRNLREPYSVPYTIGVINGGLQVRLPLVGLKLLGVPIPTVTAFTQVVTPSNLNAYPIARTYAITFLVGNSEGPPFVLPQLGANGTVFEDDIFTLNLTLDGAQIAAYGVSGLRLYRTVPGFDTSEQVGNPVETGFHLVMEMAATPGAVFTYVDNANSSKIPGDLLISDQWMPPSNLVSMASDFSSLVQTEGGWAVAVQSSTVLAGVPSTIQISERYMHAAWPPQNTYQLPEVVEGMVAFYDNVFVGTRSRPYHIHVAASEGDALDVNVRPFPDEYACVRNTLVATNSGAMYVSADGLIELTSDGDSVASKRVTNAGSVLTTPLGALPLVDVVGAAWWNGNFFGFGSSRIGYIYNSPNASNDEQPLSQIVTITTPSGVVGPNLVTGSSLYAVWGDSVYRFPLPGYGYDIAVKTPYTWRSKLYVLPGLYTMSAAKVVNDASGTLTFTLIGDGVVIYTRPITHSRPFRVPHQHRAIQWEIVLSGTSVVQEVHVATSMRDLVEEPGNA